MAKDKFIFRMIARKAFAGLFSYCHTHPLGDVDVLFGRLWTLTYFLTFDFEAIIDFN